MKPFLTMLKAASLLILFAAIGSCGKSDDDSTSNTLRTYEEIESDFQQFEYEAGTQDLSLQITEDLTYHFRVIIPDVDLTTDLPMIMALHYAAPGDPNIHKETACYIEPGLAALDAIIISPNGGVDNWGAIDNQDKVRILTDLSTRFWPVNTDQVAVVGYSNGGNGTWFYTETQPGTFSAGIAMASYYNPYTPQGTVREMPTPLYVIHGTADELFPIDTVQAWVEATQAVGSEIEFVKAPDFSHYEACRYVPYLQEAVEWLKNDIWGP